MANSVNIEDDLAELTATPDALVRKYVQELIEEDGDTQHRQDFMVSPRQTVRHLAEELRLFWQRTLAPYRSRMVSIKETDVLYRARILALDGPGSLFKDLHPGMSYQDSQLAIQANPRSRHADAEFRLNGEGFQLVPTVFGTECRLQIVPEWRPRLSYPVRGGGLLYQKPPSQSLELALGAGRASVLQALTTPASTSELAYRLMVTSSAVSQQLDRLKRAGLVEARRSGKRVYYQLTQRGEALIALFERIY
jgi:DNA-binding transcriptional ArsR family regulator